MNDRLMHLSARWFRLLGRLYPPDFRDELGGALVETYCDRARAAWQQGGLPRLALLWLRALADALRNGPGERLRPAVSWRRTGDWGRDAEIVMRRLVRARSFTLTTLGTLAVGLGLFGVVFTAVQRILIEPLPYRHSDDLYVVWRDYGALIDVRRGAVAGPDVAELQRAGGVIGDAAGLAPFLGGIFSTGEHGEPMEIAVTETTPNLFDLLGVQPALGRTFARDEVGPDAPWVIVLTHGLWTRVGADPALVGRDVLLQGRPHRVIGVLPPDFALARPEPEGPPQRIEAFVTFGRWLHEMDPEAAFYSALVRARRGAPAQEVAAAVDAVGRAVDARDFRGRGLRLYPVELKTHLVAPVRPALVVLGAAGVVLALMLLVNLASVLLARAAQREHEFAVSRALGANGLAISRATLLEGLVLGALGGAVGSLAAVWGTRALVALAPLELPRREALATDWRIALVIVGIGALLGLVAAAVPALWAARRSLAVLLAASAVRGGGGHGRLRRGMIVAQVALSLVLLSSGGLVIRSLERLLRADPGFRPDGVLTVRIRTPPEFFPEFADALAFHDRVQRTLAAIPGVSGASAATALPLTASAFQARVRFPGAPGTTGDEERDSPVADVIGARAGFVEVMGMRVRAGRTFEPERREGVYEALIDSALARQFFPGTSPLGATMPFGDRSLTIVGVVDQARLYDVHQDGRPQVLLRAEDWGYRPLFYVLRSRRDPVPLLTDVRAAVRGLDSRVAVGDVRTMEGILGNSLRQQQTSAALIGAFAIGAVLLAGMGLFSVVSGSVTRRRHELAVRLALGADHRRVVRLVIREGAALVLLGVVLGAPGIYLAERLVRGVLVDTPSSDLLALGAVALALVAIALSTCYVAARPVFTIEPARLLRQE